MKTPRLRLFLLLTLGFLASHLAQAAPGLISYQGRLTDIYQRSVSTPVVLTFTFWSAPVNGVQLGGGFSDVDSITPDAQGVYYTLIGDSPGAAIPDSVFASPEVWLDVMVGVEHLTPRKRVVSVGYALQSSLATSATLAVRALNADHANSATEADTLASVTARGAVSDYQLTLNKGAKVTTVTATQAGAAVQIENVKIVDSVIQLKSVAPPAVMTDRLVYTSGSLYWNGQPVMERQGENYVVVKTTNSTSQNATNLKAAYAKAKTLRPYGQALSRTNRAVVLVPPGTYDLGGQTGASHTFFMNAEFVDLIGMTTHREAQRIIGRQQTYYMGVLQQQANDVRIENISLYHDGSYYGHNPMDSTAYFPDCDTTHTVIRNCLFDSDIAYSMRSGWTYAGTYIDCLDLRNEGFGGEHGIASGNFENCQSGEYSFGSFSDGIASGVFTHCTAGRLSFGGWGGTASGTFTDCVSTGNCSFGGYGGVASGTFINCVSGEEAYGRSGVVSGVFVNCSGGQYSWGSVGAVSTGAKLYGCRMTGSQWDGDFAGRMENCSWSTGIRLAATARVYNSTFKGKLDLNNTAAGAAFCRAQSISNSGGNCFGVTAYNLIDGDVQ